MSFKAGLEQWNLAVQTYESKDYHNALLIFTEMGGTAKIHFNIGMIYAFLGNFDLAISSFTAAVKLDNYLAIGYFARALANLEIEDYQAAFEDFNDTILYLRGNQFIDYLQLGLDFKLYSCEVLYNRGLCYFKLGSDAEGMNDLLAALKEKKTPYHDRISRAMDDKGKEFEIYKLPENCLFRPGESMIKNTKKVDYLGQAKVIAASQEPNSLTTVKTTRQFPEPAPKNTSVPQLDASKMLSRAGTVSGPHYVPKVPGLTRSNTMQVPSLARANTMQFPSISAGTKSPLRSGSVRLNTERKLSIPRSAKPVTDAVAENFSEMSMSQASPAPASTPLTPPISSSPDDESYLLGSKPLNLINPSCLPSPFIYQYEPELTRPRAPVPRGKMKIKCHYNDTRSLMVSAAIQFDELQSRIKEKFASDLPLKLKYKDEDDELVLITDQEDLDMALGSLCPNSDGTMSHLDPGSGFDGRFELWCSV